MPFLRLRKTARMRTPDDDDWGTSFPDMDNEIPPAQILPSSSTDQIDSTTRDNHQNQTLSQNENQDTTKKQTQIQKIKQQQLTSYTCTFSPRCVISIYFLIALLFIPFGSIIIAGTSQIRKSRPISYSKEQNCSGIDQNTNIEQNTKQECRNCNCTISFEVSERIPAPSYLYYSLKNFHQNARNYAKSRSDIMNQGKIPTKYEEVSICEPDSVLYKDPESRSEDFNATDLLYPCGLTAQSFFNDTITLCKDIRCENELKVDTDGIAWKTDIEHKFQPGPASLFGDEANSKLTDPNFIVWMRLSTFSNFDKLYRVIREDIKPGQYFAKIQYRYPVASFGGTKSFYISTTQWFGAGNAFLGIAYLVVGVTALFIACTLLFNHVIKPRPMGMVDSIALLREQLAKYDQDSWQALDEED